jgi:uncharacterized protein YndB with AHSA1/START domain
MKVRNLFIITTLLVFTSAAHAEVVSSAQNGFSVRYVRNVHAAPAAAYAAFLHVESWWSSEHTYSGSASNLSLEPRAGGCFCEKLRDGGVVHMTVSYLEQNRRVVLSGALGPLQTAGLAGAMTITFKSAGDGTEVSIVYVVGGFYPGGFAEIAPGVDKVLSEQADRLQRLIDTGSADVKK